MNALIDRRWDLEFMEYTEGYGMLWAMLAADFRAAGMFANAALCDRKAEYYMPTDSGERCLIIYTSGMVVEAFPPITIYENGERRVLDVVARTELSDELVVVEVAE